MKQAMYTVSYEREDQVFGGTIWVDVPGRYSQLDAARFAEALSRRPENLRARITATGRKTRTFQGGVG